MRTMVGMETETDTQPINYKRCDRSLMLRTHEPHDWMYDGSMYLCMGIGRDREQLRGRCCADPLCPCDRKPGWGPYAAEGKVQR